MNMTKLICSNKKAFHDYFVLETFNAGIVLKGSEVKSIRNGGININDSFIQIVDGNCILKNTYIKQYEKTSVFKVDTHRNRTLLLNKAEIMKLLRQVTVKGNTLIPLKVFFERGLAKVQIGVCKGKKLYDKREVLKEKTLTRTLQRELKSF